LINRAPTTLVAEPFTAMADKVSLALTITGPEYTVDDVVGIEPSVVK